MSIAKPTIVFVTGAWHSPELYKPLTSALESAGYTVKAPHLPSVGGEQDSFKEDVNVVREAIEASVTAGQDVVIVMHSYGGVVGSEAAEGFSRLDKPSGDRERGSVVHLVYVTAFALAEKKSLSSALGGKPLDWYEEFEGKQWKLKDSATKVLFNDVEQEKIDEVLPQLQNHAKGTFDSKVTYAAWKHIQSTYVLCELDQAIPAEVQENMATQHGNKITIEKLEAGHSPFLSKTDETVKLIRKAIGEKV